MARHALRNQGGVPFLTLEGFFVVRQSQMPDGDTIAFAASRSYRSGPVETNIPVNSTGAKTVNIRLQSIDAPEKAQPLGAGSRNKVLRQLGFDPASLGLSDEDFTADGPTKKFAGWLATHGLDGNQRPLGYVFHKNPGFNHGRIVSAADVRSVLTKSANYRQCSRGWAFPAFYENTDETHAAIFQAAAQRARNRRNGVWGADRTTTGFVPTKNALDADGWLVYPKFFRRVSEWKDARPNGAAFIQWLKKQSDGRKLVRGAKPSPVPLWTLFEVVGTRKVAVPYDVSRLWFSE